MKIRTIQRNFGTPIEMNPRTAEYIVYVEGNRRRTEERRVQRNALWPGGPRVSFYEPHSAVIESCEGNTKKAFSLDLDKRAYAPFERRQKLDADRAKAIRDRTAKDAPPMRPTVLHEITTVDTGERKESFGYTARHVIRTYKVIPLEGSTTVRPMETITDGWYIDRDTRISRDPQNEPPREGTTYAGARLVVGSPNEAAASASPPSLVQTTYIGKPETGFPIRVRTTNRCSVQGQEQVTTSEIEVTEMSTKALDPSLFEVPKNFRSVTRNLPWPRPALWARWLVWGHQHWVRFARLGVRGPRDSSTWP